jgi:AraC-like DNA-binding protein
MQCSVGLDTIPRPVIALADEYKAGFTDPLHSHRRAQLLYAASGVMSVRTDERCYIIPPQRAVWLPAGVPHEVSCRGPVSLRTLYIEPGVAPGLPDQCCVIEVVDLMRALILEAVQFDPEYDEAGREGRIVRFLLDELAAVPVERVHARMPQDKRLERVCRAMLAEPSRDDGLDYFANLAGMGRRTLTRRFRQETGISVVAWRQHVRLLDALSRLAEGQSVTTVAFDVGYESLSAFTTVFQKTFGVPPSRYFDRH